MKITVRPKFLERIEGTENEVCEVCRYHKIIILQKQKRGIWVVMHTDIGLGPFVYDSPRNTLHIWREHEKKPDCLKHYREVGYVD